MNEEKSQLIRGLTLTDTTALVVGTVIGSGVFLKTAVMAQEVGTPTLVLLAWVAAGLLSLAGALTYAELGAMLPNAGGEYLYLRKSYGEAAAFLFGWQRFIVAGSASIASLASGFAIFLAAFLPLNAVWAEREVSLLGRTLPWQFGPRQLVAVGAILFLSIVNCFAVALGGKVQSALTVLKIAGIAFVVLGSLPRARPLGGRELPLREVGEQGGEGAVQDGGFVSRRHGVAEQVLREAQLLLRSFSCLTEPLLAA